jgi:tetratricopeptide (TPR) repeat protein
MKIKILILIPFLLAILAFGNTTLAVEPPADTEAKQAEEHERVVIDKRVDGITIIVNSLPPEKRESAPDTQDWGETLKRTEKGLDRVIAILGYTLTALSIVTVVAGLFVTFFSLFIWRKMKSWETLKEDVEKKAAVADEKLIEAEAKLNKADERLNDIKKKSEEAGKILDSKLDEINEKLAQAKEDAEFIHNLKESTEKIKTDVANVQKELPPITEKPSKALKDKVDELAKKIDFLEDVGVTLTAEDYLTQATDYFYDEQYEEALEAYEKAIKLRPDYSLAWNNKGYSLHDLKRYKEALAAYEKALELDPDDPIAWNNKGAALNDLERYEEALEALEKSIELNPEYAKSWKHKGLALNCLERHDEALEALNKALELDPDYASAWNNKGVALEKLGRDAEAKKAFAEAKRLDPDIEAE